MTDTKKIPGRFVWHELMSHDVKKAAAFYGELFGWKSQQIDMGPKGSYTMLKLGDKEIGGIASLEGRPNVPNYWMAYCTVSSVDETVGRATKIGGTVLVPPTNIPNMGRFAIVRDPQGAVLGPWTGEQESPEHNGPPDAGTFCWDELQTADPKEAVAYYGQLYGWTAETRDMGPMGTYYRLMSGAKNVGGAMKAPMPGQGSNWLHYVASENVDATAKRAEGLRAKVVVPPSDIPGIGRFSVFSDPSGAVFAVFKADPAYAADRANVGA